MLFFFEGNNEDDAEGNDMENGVEDKSNCGLEDSGARAMLQSVTDKITVPMPEAALDIDTVEDLKKL